MRKDFRMKLVKGSVDDTGSFTAYASTYGGPPDLVGDIIAPGAFANAIYNQGADGNYPLLWQHETDKPIGVGRISDDAKGLKVDGRLVMPDPLAQVAHAHLKAGSIKAMSIGYDVPAGRSTIDSATGVRTINEVRLFEVSLVTIPANPLAVVTSVKNLDDARRIMREIASHPEDEPQITALRGLLKDITTMLDPEDDECECGAEDPEDCECDEEDATLKEEKAAVLALQKIVLELKGQNRARVGAF